VQWVIGGCGCVCRKVSAEGMFVSYRSAAGQDQASSRGWGGGDCLVGQQQLCYRKSPGRVEAVECCSPGVLPGVLYTRVLFG
jgi:hypothetical protein